MDADWHSVHWCFILLRASRDNLAGCKDRHILRRRKNYSPVNNTSLTRSLGCITFNFYIKNTSTKANNYTDNSNTQVHNCYIAPTCFKQIIIHNFTTSYRYRNPWNNAAKKHKKIIVYYRLETVEMTVAGYINHKTVFTLSFPATAKASRFLCPAWHITGHN